MPSTRKQRTRGKRSRHSDVISSIENLDVMLGSFPGNNLGNDSENEQDIDSLSPGLNDNAVTLRKNYWSPLNSNSRGNSEGTIETVRAINE